MIEKQVFKVHLKFTEKMLGFSPKSQQVFTDYIASKSIEKHPDKKDAILSEAETLEKTEEKGWTGFHHDEKGLFIYDYAVRGFLKSAAHTLAGQLEVKASRSKVDNFLFVFPRKIHLLDEKGKPIKKSHGVLERPLRAQTIQGPRITLVRSDYVNAGSQIEFDLHSLKSGFNPFTEKNIYELLSYGQYEGISQFRSGSYGRFTFTLKGD